MQSLRKWFYRPKKDDQSLLAQFFYADEALTLVAAELDSFDGREDPERCTALVNHLRQCQDNVLNICNKIMDVWIPDDRANRDFRVKFPDDVMQDNLAGQLWFGAECLAAGSSIMNREAESAAMRPLAKALTKSLENVRNLLREYSLRSTHPGDIFFTDDLYIDRIFESLKVFDRLLAEFELGYVTAMVPVKTAKEYEMQQLVMVLFSETLQRALRIGLLTQDMIETYEPSLMFTIPRLAIVTGLLVYPRGPLSLDKEPSEMSEMFRPFRMLLVKIRELLWTLNESEIARLERLLCSVDEPTASSSTGEGSAAGGATSGVDTRRTGDGAVAGALGLLQCYNPAEPLLPNTVEPDEDPLLGWDNSTCETVREVKRHQGGKRGRRQRTHQMEPAVVDRMEELNLPSISGQDRLRTVEGEVASVGSVLERLISTHGITDRLTAHEENAFLSRTNSATSLTKAVTVATMIDQQHSCIPAQHRSQQHSCRYNTSTNLCCDVHQAGSSRSSSCTPGQCHHSCAHEHNSDETNCDIRNIDSVNDNRNIPSTILDTSNNETNDDCMQQEARFRSNSTGLTTGTRYESYPCPPAVCLPRRGSRLGSSPVDIGLISRPDSRGALSKEGNHILRGQSKDEHLKDSSVPGDGDSIETGVSGHSESLHVETENHQLKPESHQTISLTPGRGYLLANQVGPRNAGGSSSRHHRTQDLPNEDPTPDYQPDSLPDGDCRLAMCLATNNLEHFLDRDNRQGRKRDEGGGGCGSQYTDSGVCTLQSNSDDNMDEVPVQSNSSERTTSTTARSDEKSSCVVNPNISNVHTEVDKTCANCRCQLESSKTNKKPFIPVDNQSCDGTEPFLEEDKGCDAANAACERRDGGRRQQSRLIRTPNDIKLHANQTKSFAAHITSSKVISDVNNVTETAPNLDQSSSTISSPTSARETSESSVEATSFPEVCRSETSTSSCLISNETLTDTDVQCSSPYSVECTEMSRLSSLETSLCSDDVTRDRVIDAEKKYNEEIRHDQNDVIPCNEMNLGERTPNETIESPCSEPKQDIVKSNESTSSITPSGFTSSSSSSYSTASSPYSAPMSPNSDESGKQSGQTLGKCPFSGGAIRDELMNNLNLIPCSGSVLSSPYSEEVKDNVSNSSTHKGCENISSSTYSESEIKGDTLSVSNLDPNNVVPSTPTSPYSGDTRTFSLELLEPLRKKLNPSDLSSPYSEDLRKDASSEPLTDTNASLMSSEDVKEDPLYKSLGNVISSDPSSPCSDDKQISQDIKSKVPSGKVPSGSFSRTEGNISQPNEESRNTVSQLSSPYSEDLTSPLTESFPSEPSDLNVATFDTRGCDVERNIDSVTCSCQFVPNTDSCISTNECQCGVPCVGDSINDKEHSTHTLERQSCQETPLSVDTSRQLSSSEYTTDSSRKLSSDFTTQSTHCYSQASSDTQECKTADQTSSGYSVDNSRSDQDLGKAFDSIDDHSRSELERSHRLPYQTSSGYSDMDDRSYTSELSLDQSPQPGCQTDCELTDKLATLKLPSQEESIELVDKHVQSVNVLDSHRVDSVNTHPIDSQLTTSHPYPLSSNTFCDSTSFSQLATVGNSVSQTKASPQMESQVAPSSSICDRCRSLASTAGAGSGAGAAAGNGSPPISLYTNQINCKRKPDENSGYPENSSSGGNLETDPKPPGFVHKIRINISNNTSGLHSVISNASTLINISSANNHVSATSPQLRDNEGNSRSRKTSLITTTSQNTQINIITNENVSIIEIDQSNHQNLNQDSVNKLSQSNHGNMSEKSLKGTEESVKMEPPVVSILKTKWRHRQRRRQNKVVKRRRRKVVV
ncbi:hypothetical protein WDU94_002684 [Cyamophila willieti]